MQTVRYNQSLRTLHRAEHRVARSHGKMKPVELQTSSTVGLPVLVLMNGLLSPTRLATSTWGIQSRACSVCREARLPHVSVEERLIEYQCQGSLACPELCRLLARNILSLLSSSPSPLFFFLYTWSKILENTSAILILLVYYFFVHLFNVFKPHSYHILKNT